MGGGTIADKDEDKDAEKDVDENKDLMKNDSVQSLSYPHLPTPTQFQLYRFHHNPPRIVGRSVLSVWLRFCVFYEHKTRKTKTGLQTYLLVTYELQFRLPISNQAHLLTFTYDSIYDTILYINQ